jgi:Flp pilus assembly pilin Flp
MTGNTVKRDSWWSLYRSSVIGHRRAMPLPSGEHNGSGYSDLCYVSVRLSQAHDFGEEQAMKSREWFGSFLQEESGKVPIEYAVALALIAAGIIVGLRSMGNSVSNQNNATSSLLNGGPIPSSS